MFRSPEMASNRSWRASALAAPFLVGSHQALCSTWNTDATATGLRDFDRLFHVEHLFNQNNLAFLFITTS